MLYRIDPQRALNAVRQFLEDLQDLEWSKEFKALDKNFHAEEKRRYEAWKDRFEKESADREKAQRLSEQFRILKAEASFAGWFDWTGARYRLNKFKSEHPDVNEFTGRMPSWDSLRDHRFRGDSPFMILLNAKQVAEQDRDLVAMLVEEPVQMEEVRISRFARYESGEEFRCLKEKCEALGAVREEQEVKE